MKVAQGLLNLDKYLFPRYTVLVIPIFKSSFSIGKSILTLDGAVSDDGPDSIISMCLDNAIDTLVLVEDTMTGFIKAHKACEENDIKLIFGLRISCCNTHLDESTTSNHKIIIFSKNDEGCRLLNKISSHASINCNGRVDFDYLNSIWTEDLELVIPFYDSFIFNNNITLSNCVPDFSKITPSFLIEENGLPFDHIVKDCVTKLTSGNKNYKSFLGKSIFYKNKKDYESLQTYKILCNRTFGKTSSLSSPNLNHFGSNEFCFESFLEKNK
jgi:DNA polymerase III alpha subunit